MAQTQLERIMTSLRCTREEAEQILADDKAIDRGERMYFDLDPQKEKEAKKIANCGTRKTPTTYSLDNAKGKRNRKENPTKSAIISEIAKFLEENSENDCKNVIITNKERQISFKIGENNYEFTLVQKRKPKN